MISNDRFKFIIYNTDGMALDAIWLYLEEDSDSYDERKKLFLWVLEKMLNDGLIRLAKNDVVLDISAEEASERFRNSFPEDDEDLNNGVWFFTNECPAGIGWVLPDDSINWV